MAGLWKTIERLGTTVSVLQFLGVPAVSGILAAGSGWWGSSHSATPLGTFLIILIVFVTSLWSGIGVYWLMDRSRKEGLSAKKLPVDCAWGLRVDSATLTRDVNNKTSEWQVSVEVRNTLDWPLRLKVLRRDVVIEERVPTEKFDYDLPAIVQKHASVKIHFFAFKKNILPNQERYKGTIDLAIAYGHPEDGYSRKMTRHFLFEQIVFPTPLMPGATMFPVNMNLPLNLGPYKEDTDTPWSGDS